MGKDAAQRKKIPCWSVDMDWDVWKLSTETPVNLGNEDSFLHLASCFPCKQGLSHGAEALMSSQKFIILSL